MTKLEKQEELVADFIVENKDPISAFYDYIVEQQGDTIGMARWINGRTTEDVYSQYCKWCEQCGVKAETNKTFTLRFSKKLPGYVTKKLQKLAGNVYNIYLVNGGMGI